MCVGLQSWHWECAKCGYEKADFEPVINETFAHEQIDENLREKGLQSLRITNFNKLLKVIFKYRSTAGRLLDVGCAHGWFLEAAQKYGFETLGIEPDLNMFNATAQRGLTIRQGFFPEVLEAHDQFDIIVFNDVFEHIPDINAVLRDCKSHLKPGGMLVLNLPSSLGLFYKVARLLSRLRVKSFIERLWQKGFPSPHLHYFNPKNLQLLLQLNGFEEVAKGRLSTLRLQGLFARVSHTGNHSFPVSMGIVFFAAFALPIVWVMPSDIVYSIYKRQNIINMD
jgi:2-polyprenyl-3-methyl-5-hydroxy-6-metoxy-1,4-benzoquinol methylase